jgi:hypothetical protein
MGVTWTEFYTMSVPLRMWLIERTRAELNKSQDGKNAPSSKAPHDNTPDIRSMLGKQRSEVPAKLRRF